jgi:hypothetical protein
VVWVGGIVIYRFEVKGKIGAIMPSHRVHTYMDWQLFNRSYRKLHRAIDKPYLVFGRKHRMFFHDFPSAVGVARIYFPGNFQAQEAAMFHVHLDNLCSQDRFFKRRLEILADSYYRNKRKSGKKRKKAKRSVRRPKEINDFLAFCNKAKQAQDLIVQIKSLG